LSVGFDLGQLDKHLKIPIIFTIFNQGSESVKRTLEDRL
jgi:hypothetical protein